MENLKYVENFEKKLIKKHLHYKMKSFILRSVDDKTKSHKIKPSYKFN